VNDTYGHDNGDLLLQQVAQRLFLNARESDTVARFSGDEFVVMSEFLNPNYEEAREQALFAGVKLIELFEKDFLLNEISCRLNINIGVYLFNGDNKTVDYMIKRADSAMHQAKALGRNQLVISGQSWVSDIAANS
jgi:diguanylate cyclase (GGDEF)-like protein